MSVSKIGAAVTALFVSAMVGGSALAQEAAKAVGAPQPKQLGLQEAASPVMATARIAAEMLQPG